MEESAASSSSPSYAAMTDSELINCAHQYSERAPIDMESVGIALVAAASMLRISEPFGVARDRLIGHLYMFDALIEDMRRPTAPHAADGDVIFCNRSWVPGRAVEAIVRLFAQASIEAKKQRAAALERAGLSDLPAHDHRRYTREDLECQA